MRMEKFLLLNFGIIFAIYLGVMNLYARQSALTNKVNWSWYTTNMTYKWSNTTATNTDFYKFIIITPGYDINNPYPMPGDTIHIRFTIYNVGSIDETNGISLSALFNTNIGTISITSNTNLTSVMTNISSLTSGDARVYWVNIIISSNAPEGSYPFFVTNKSLSVSYPLIVIYSNTINVSLQNVTVYSAHDGVHTITKFDGTGVLGDLDVTIDMSFYKPPQEAYLYYDIDGIPDGSDPDGTIYKNRRVQIYKTGNIYRAVIPITDPEIKAGKKLNFIIVADNHKFYYSGNIPYSYFVKYYTVQKQEGEEPVIILNNVGDFSKTPVRIIYTLYNASFVNITVYNLRGEIIRILKSETMPVGKHIEVWDGKNDYGKDVAPGLYFILVHTNEYGAVRKILYVKTK